MPTPEKNLGKLDDPNKLALPDKTKGTQRSYDQTIEAAKIDAANHPHPKVTTDNAASIVNDFEQRFNRVMQYAQEHDSTLEEAANQFNQEEQKHLDHLYAQKLAAEETARLRLSDTSNEHLTSEFRGLFGSNVAPQEISVYPAQETREVQNRLDQGKPDYMKVEALVDQLVIHQDFSQEQSSYLYQRLFTNEEAKFVYDACCDGIRPYHDRGNMSSPEKRRIESRIKWKIKSRTENYDL